MIGWLVGWCLAALAVQIGYRGMTAQEINPITYLLQTTGQTANKDSNPGLFAVQASTVTIRPQRWTRR